MDGWWSVLAVLGTVVLPMALAWWLLGRPPRGTVRRREPHGKIPPNDRR